MKKLLFLIITLVFLSSTLVYCKEIVIKIKQSGNTAAFQIGNEGETNNVLGAVYNADAPAGTDTMAVVATPEGQESQLTDPSNLPVDSSQLETLFTGVASGETFKEITGGDAPVDEEPQTEKQTLVETGGKTVVEEQQSLAFYDGEAVVNEANNIIYVKAYVKKIIDEITKSTISTVNLDSGETININPTDVKEDQEDFADQITAKIFEYNVSDFNPGTKYMIQLVGLDSIINFTDPRKPIAPGGEIGFTTGIDSEPTLGGPSQDIYVLTLKFNSTIQELIDKNVELKVSGGGVIDTFNLSGLPNIISNGSMIYLDADTNTGTEIRVNYGKSESKFLGATFKVELLSGTEPKETMDRIYFDDLRKIGFEESGTINTKPDTGLDNLYKANMTLKSDIDALKGLGIVLNLADKTIPIDTEGKWPTEEEKQDLTSPVDYIYSSETGLDMLVMDKQVEIRYFNSYSGISPGSTFVVKINGGGTGKEVTIKDPRQQ